ncbi:hypothetical protein J6590_096858, partial [Homalodisca vitripennis]
IYQRNNPALSCPPHTAETCHAAMLLQKNRQNDRRDDSLPQTKWPPPEQIEDDAIARAQRRLLR